MLYRSACLLYCVGLLLQVKLRIICGNRRLHALQEAAREFTVCARPAIIVHDLTHETSQANSFALPDIVKLTEPCLADRLVRVSEQHNAQRAAGQTARQREMQLWTSIFGIAHQDRRKETRSRQHVADSSQQQGSGALICWQESCFESSP